MGFDLPPWWNGRHTRLKILRRYGVRVRVPLAAPPWETKAYKVLS